MDTFVVSVCPLDPDSSDFGDVCALYAPFLHQLTMQSSLFACGCPTLVVVCVSRKLPPCPSYSRRRDRINLGLWRSLYKGGAGYSLPQNRTPTYQRLTWTGSTHRAYKAQSTRHWLYCTVTQSTPQKRPLNLLALLTACAQTNSILSTNHLLNAHAPQLLTKRTSVHKQIDRTVEVKYQLHRGNTPARVTRPGGLGAPGQVFPRFGVAPRVGVKDSHSSCGHLSGASRTRRGFFDFEVGGHDGAYKGKVHVIVLFIGRKKWEFN